MLTRGRFHHTIQLVLTNSYIINDSGLTKQSEPAAILVRSGDVLILADSARRYYHGVPRIFHDRTFDRILAEHLHQMDEALLEHMAGRRINVSIRDTR